MLNSVSIFQNRVYEKGGVNGKHGGGSQSRVVLCPQQLHNYLIPMKVEARGAIPNLANPK